MLRLFDTTGFPPRWLCGGGWTPLHGYTHIVSDLLIFGAYLAIPLSLAYFLRKRGHDLPFPTVGWLFVVFIMACGTTHLLDAVMFYWPAYRLLALMKVVTAVASWGTVVVLVSILPVALTLPGRVKLAGDLEREMIERDRTERLARERAAFVRGVLDSLPEIIAVLDRSGNIISVNEAWRRHHRERVAASADGRQHSSADGQSYFALSGVIFPTDPHSERAVAERLERLLADGAAFSAEYKTKVGTAPSRWIHIRGTPLQNDHGGGVISHHDITPRKQVEAALVEARSAADAASEAKSRFLANMSHEIRTPMTAVLGYADLLGEELREPSHLESVDLLRRHGRFLLDILDDILDLSKIEAGKLEVEATEFPLAPMLADVESLMQVRAGEKGIGLAIEYEGQVPSLVRSDPVRLRQILMNLVGNAIKFTHEGSVRLRVLHLPGGEMSGELPLPPPEDAAVRLAAPAIRPAGPGKLLFEVIDTGIGLSGEQLSHLFRAFTQADASTTRKYGGTGLGLAICKNLAALLGGQIWATSTQGRGSEFRVTIASDVGRPVPAVSPEDTAATPDAPQPGPTVTRIDGLRLLLAEDTPGIRHLVGRMLTLAGAAVTAVENGRLAVEAVRDAGPGGFDLVLMDVQMPELNGFDATRRMRQSGCVLPIVALTAGAMAGDRERCLEAGYDAYVAKPIDRGELLRTITQLTAGVAKS